MTTTIVRRRGDGALVRVEPDGRETPVVSASARPMTEEEIVAAALSDPDGQPLTDERLAKMRRVPRAKSLRRALRLTQQEFSDRYGIPIGTLRDWEQGRSEPDQTARSYLRAIAGDPEGVARALGRVPSRAA